MSSNPKRRAHVWHSMNSKNEVVMTTELKEKDYILIAIDYAQKNEKLCEFMQKVTSKFKIDLFNAHSNKDTSRYEFKEENAIEACLYIEQHRHVKGRLTGQLLNLEPWQIFFFVNAFAWVDKKTNELRYKKLILKSGKHNGSELMQLVYASTCIHIGLYKNFSVKGESKRFKDLFLRNFKSSLPTSARTGHSDYRNLGVLSLIRGDSFDCLNQALPAFIAYSRVKVGVNTQYEELIWNAAMSQHWPEKDTFICIYECDQHDNLDDPAVFVKANPNIDVSVKKEYLINQAAKNGTSSRIINSLRANFGDQVILKAPETYVIKEELEREAHRARINNRNGESNVFLSALAKIKELECHPRKNEMPVLMSEANPDGWALESLALQLASEVIAKDLIMHGDCRLKVFQVSLINKQIIDHLHLIRSLQEQARTLFAELGKDQPPLGKPRSGVACE